MSPADLARHLNVQPSQVQAITTEEVAVTAEMALRLGKYFRTSPDLWLNMQTTYELKIQSVALQAELAKITEIERVDETSAAPAT